MLKNMLMTMACLGVLTASASAQEATTVVPGDARISVARVSLTTDTFVIENYRQGALWRSSKLVRTVDRVTENGRALLRQAQTYDTPDGTTVDTTWIDAKTLAPVRYFADVYGEIQKFTFDSLAAQGMVTPRDSAARDVSFAAPAPFFNAVAMDLLIQALRFEPATGIKFVAYNPPMRAIDIDLKHVAQEKLPLKKGGEIDVIRVSFNNRSHLWLDAKTGALLINGGGTGGNAFWKVRSDVDATALIKASLESAR